MSSCTSTFKNSKNIFKHYNSNQSENLSILSDAVGRRSTSFYRAQVNEKI